MKNTTRFKRLLFIIEIIKQNISSSKKDIINILSIHGLKVSERTLSRDFEDIGSDFGIYIKRVKRGIFSYYEIENIDRVDIKDIFQSLNMLGMALAVNDNVQNNGESLSTYISFEKSSNQDESSAFFQKIYQAIKDSRRIEITYKSFRRKEAKTYILEPSQLKEYANRWYVCGTKKGELDSRYTLALDRVLDVKMLVESNVENENLDWNLHFDPVIGITKFTNSKREFFEISFSPEHGHYIKTNPMHHSQKVLIDNEKEFRIQLFVAANPELKQLLCAAIDSVKIIKPLWLRDEFAKCFEEAAKRQYS